MTMPPQEAAPTIEERRAARRANQTTFNLVIALIASLGIVALLIIVVVRPDVPRPDLQDIDYRANAQNAQVGFEEQLVVPDLPGTWTANRAEGVGAGADGVARFDIGFITPAGAFLELTQGVDANPTWLAAQVKDATAGPGLTIGGIRWTVYDRRDAPDPGNVAYALVAESGASTFVISGTAGDAEFEELATAVSKELS